MNRRRRRSSRPLELRDLVLVTTTEEGEVRLPGLTLSASAEAVSVTGPARQVLRSWSWSEIGRLDVDGWAEGPDGRPRQVLDVAAAERRHRFLVSAPELSIFLTATALWHGPPTGSPDAATTAAADAAPDAAPDAAAAMGAPPTPGVRRWAKRREPRPAAHGSRARTRRRDSKRGWLGFTRLARPRHARLLRVRPVPACLGAALLIGGGATFGAIGTGGAQAANRTGAGGGVSIMSRMAREYASRITAKDLPAATTAPTPAPPALATSAALQSHEIFGFAPYWTLPQSGGFDVADMTTIAYFSVGVNGDGSVQASGPGWAGYQSQDLADLITRAHAAGSRVVLTVTCFGQGALNQLTSDPTAPGRLSASLAQLISAKNLDGVNFDFEGEGSADQAGLDSLIAQVSGALRAQNAHWQVTMDTYASSAGDPGGFYDIAGLAPSVDAFFVMAYDMNGSSPSPTAALTGSGFTDLDALQEYTAVVPASKVILGVPYYGYDWPTTGPGLGAAATGHKSPLSYSQIAAANHPTYWDPATQTAWTSYQVGSQWHQTWFDDPTSLALKAQLAGTFDIAGLGVWALGMDGNDPTMLAALLGHAPVLKDYLPGPGATTPTTSSTTSTTGPAAPGYSYTGVWNGSPVALTPAVLADLPDDGEGVAAGTLATFATDDPSVACLTTGGGGPLQVSELLGEPGVYLVSALTPVDCTEGWWTFTPPSLAGGGPGGGGTTTTTSTTSTTTTTTTLPVDPTTTTTVPTG